MGKSHSRSPNDQRSDALNPTSSEHQMAIDNRSSQMNPDNSEHSSQSKGIDTDDYSRNESLLHLLNEESTRKRINRIKRIQPEKYKEMIDREVFEQNRLKSLIPIQKRKYLEKDEYIFSILTITKKMDNRNNFYLVTAKAIAKHSNNKHAIIPLNVITNISRISMHENGYKFSINSTIGKFHFYSLGFTKGLHGIDPIEFRDYIGAISEFRNRVIDAIADYDGDCCRRYTAYAKVEIYKKDVKKELTNPDNEYQVCRQCMKKISLIEAECPTCWPAVDKTTNIHTNNALG